VQFLVGEMEDPMNASPRAWFSAALRFSLLLLAGWMILLGEAGGREPASNADAPAEPPQRKREVERVGAAVVEAMASTPRELRISGFEFHETKWDQVFAWVTEHTGVPIVTSFSIAGSFSFTPCTPDAKSRIHELMDILNDALLKQGPGFVLIRRERSMILCSANGGFDAPMLPRITPDDLDSYGRTELAYLVITINRLVATELAREVEKRLGRLSSVTTRSNKLLLSGTVGDLRIVCQHIHYLEELAKQRQPSVYNVLHKQWR
jgi:hypothetical protein